MKTTLLALIGFLAAAQAPTPAAPAHAALLTRRLGIARDGGARCGSDGVKMGVAFLSRWAWLVAAVFALLASFALQRGLVAADEVAVALVEPPRFVLFPTMVISPAVPTAPEVTYLVAVKVQGVAARAAVTSAVGEA